MFDPNYMNAAMSHAPNFFTEVRNPKWTDQTKTKIACEVNFKHVNFEEWTSFCADPTDYMPYSKEIFDRAVAGEFGDIAEPPVVVVEEMPTPEQIAAYKRSQNAILGQIGNQISGVIL